MTVTFTPGPANTTGVVYLQAADDYDYQSTGSFNVFNVTPPPPPVTPTGPLVARDLCLTIAVGPSAAYECGDLRIVHPLPSVRTLGKVRTPTLIYSSQQAHPFPSVNTDLALAANDRPDSIIAIARLKVGGSFVQEDRRAWAGSQWGAPSQAATRRVMTNFTTDTLATGLYAYQLELDRLVIGSGPTAIRVDTGTVMIVNRFRSPFGAGWWLAGFEQLQFPSDGSIMWIGGDGSVRRYVNAGSWSGKTWYLARPVDGPDTLSFDGATYTRYLKGGTKVLFNSSGFHIQTVNRLGYSTVFAPDGGSRLSTITVPPSGSGLTYTFTYGGANGTLSSVTAPDTLGGSGRVTMISGTALTGGARVAAITDPGASASVQFAYGNGSYPAAITARTDRLLATTSYTLGTGLKFVGDSLPVPGAQTITRTFCPAEVHAFVCGNGLTSPESTYTIYNGPRTDVTDITHFWLDSLGAVTQMRDAYNSITTIARTEARWPTLPTRTRAPNGRIMGASYDARGNLAAVVDSNPYNNGQNPSTQYAWDQTWDQLTQITLPNGQVTQFGVDPSNGNRLWVQDGRGTVSRTTFNHYATGPAAGLLSAVILPGGAQQSLEYDGAGDVSKLTSPMGLVTYHLNDRLGRTTVVKSPGLVYRNDSSAYDAADRVVRTSSYAPATDSASVGLLTVRNFYDDENNLRRVERSQSPNVPGLSTLITQWHFDAAGRRTAEISPDGAIDSTRFDPAGNPVWARTRRGDTLSMVYDRMNRLLQRTVTGVHYDGRNMGMATMSLVDHGTQTYPWYPNDGGSGWSIAGDVETFGYDAIGNLVAADNGDAVVRRTYYKDARVATDTTFLRTYSGSDFSRHVYGLRYFYDVNGRPTTLKHPYLLAPHGSGARDSTVYQYDATTGELSHVLDPMGNDFHFLYNTRGERVRIDMPGGIVDTLGFDPDGRLVYDRVRNHSQSQYKATDSLLRNTVLTYIDPLRVSQAANNWGWRDTSTSTYSGLGQLVHLKYRYPVTNGMGDPAQRTSDESFTVDPLGNAYHNVVQTNLSIPGGGYGSSTTFTRSSVFASGTGRLSATSDASLYRTDTYLYDAAGNTEFSYQSWADPYWNTVRENRASFYGADGRLRLAEWRMVLCGAPNCYWPGAPWWAAFEEFRYDALGRRVLVRDRRMCFRTENASVVADCNRSHIRRTVWDGNRELWEIQMPGSDADNLENDTIDVARPTGTIPLIWDQNPLFGRVGYTHGLGVDAPLSITRTGLFLQPALGGQGLAVAPLTVVPQWNWRGRAEYGTFGDGGRKLCLDSSRCTLVQWRGTGFAYEQQTGWLAYSDTAFVWSGTLIENKEDGTGTLYRLKRYVDPATGRFTQEDPIGLAGGLNLYGFAGGDPLTFSDPFGLCPLAKDGIPCTAVYVGGAYVTSGALRLALDAMAAEVDHALLVSSGDRSVKHNHDIGGATRSAHLEGFAADVEFEGMTKQETADALFHSTAREHYGVRLIYHGPGAKLHEHSHVDLRPGTDLREEPKGSKPRYVPLTDPAEHQ